MLIDAALLDAPEPRARAEDAGARAARPTPRPGSRSTSNSPKQIGEILFERLELPVIKKTPSGAPSTDEDVLEKLALDYPLPKIAARVPRAVQAQVHLHRQAAAHGEPAHRPRAHQLRAGDGGDRAARVERSQPAEHPGAHAPRAGASARPSSRRRGTRSSRPTTRRSSCASWRTSRTTQGLLRRLRARRGHPPRDRRGDLRPQPARGQRRAAALRQGDQLRPHLRHVARSASRSSSASSARPRRPTSTATSRATRASRATWTTTRQAAREQGYVETVFGRRLWLPEIRSAQPGAARRAPSARRSTRRCRARPPT